MTIVRLVRHAEPAEVVGVDPDLTELGFSQAAALATTLEPCSLVTSPLQRARSTARPLEHAWGVEAVVGHAVRELPSPSSTDVDRGTWLRQALRSTFAELGDEHRAWRDGIIDFVASRRVDTVVVTHAVVVNALVGHCLGDDRLWHVRPGHTSITTVDVDGTGHITLVQLGTEATTRIT